MPTNHDTDPTPAHGLERPVTKTHVLDRLHEELLIQRLDVLTAIGALTQQIDAYTTEITKLTQRSDKLTEDINTIEQLLIDMFPEPID